MGGEEWEDVSYLAYWVVLLGCGYEEGLRGVGGMAGKEKFVVHPQRQFFAVLMC